MRYEKFDVRCEGSQDDAALYVYILDRAEEILVKSRPMIVICPGGAYLGTSDREAEIVAMQFLAMGYHAAVLRYSVKPAVFPAANLELGKSMVLIREHAQDWGVENDKIVVTGFSAGGHMAASYCMFWNQGFIAQKLGVSPALLRPSGMVLGYPVITSGEYAHHDSIKNLLGAEYEEKKEQMSLEKCVNQDVPRSFIWHTYEDDLVPVQNSILLVDALVKAKIPTEFHMFAKGGHGLSLANRMTQNQWFGVEPTCQPWVELLHNWLEAWCV